MHASRRSLVPLVSLALIVAGALLGSPGAQATPDSQAPPQTRPVSSPAASRALAHAQALLAPGTTAFSRRATRPADRTATHDATMVLRELRLRLDELDTADRAAAARVLARPGGDTTRRFGSVLVHYSSGNDHITGAYVAEVGRTVQHVLSTYAAAGYKRPEPDGTRGGDAKLDIYLKNLGSQGLYGYCNSDRNPPDEGPYDTWAYCAFDDDYEEFPAHSPQQNLHVTAAHELFHAVQFAYDYFEDPWFMEATATWAEDELYDGVNDNLQYLAQSPLTQPGVSFDHFGGVRQYGDWIFFRYLTERFGKSTAGMPTLVRDMWRRADGSGSPKKDQYSIQAVRTALAARGAKLSTVFSGFAAANRHPATAYDEGRANHYRTAPLAARRTLSGAHRDSGWISRRVDHLAAATVRLTPAKGMRSHWALKVRVDLPPSSRGAAATVTVHRRSGAVRASQVRLDRAGNGARRVVFGTSQVTAVEVTLANGGTHYRCWRRTAYSCQGKSTDNDLPLRVRATAVR